MLLIMPQLVILSMLLSLHTSPAALQSTACICQSNVEDNPKQLKANLLESLDRFYLYYSNCILQMHSQLTHIANNAAIFTHDESIIFARHGTTMLTDSSLIIKQLKNESDGYPRKGLNVCNQFYLIKGKPVLSISYNNQPDGKKVPFIAGVMNDVETDHGREMTIYGNARLQFILEFDIYELGFRELLEHESVKYTQIGNVIRCERKDQFANFILEAQIVGNRYRLTKVAIFQDTNNIVGPRAPMMKLFEVTIDQEKKHPLQKSSYIIEFLYDDPGNPMQLSGHHTFSERVAESYRTESKRMTKYVRRQAIDDPSAIEQLRIQVPDNQLVQAKDDLENIDFVVKSGEVVRKVDGAPLAQVQVELAQARRTRWIIGSAVGLLVVLTLGWWFRQRRRTARTAQP